MPKLHQISCLELSHGTSGGFRKTTNNRMEIFAAIAGLELLKQRYHGIGVAQLRALRGSFTEAKVSP
jgi:ribonuclease HI